MNEHNKAFPDYGGRGIMVCERWNSFQNFLDDMGPRPPDTSLERVNNNGNYEPSNCVWATDKVQAGNRRRATIIRREAEAREREALHLLGLAQAEIAEFSEAIIGIDMVLAAIEKKHSVNLAETRSILAEYLKKLKK